MIHFTRNRSLSRLLNIFLSVVRPRRMMFNNFISSLSPRVYQTIQTANSQLIEMKIFPELLLLRWRCAARCPRRPGEELEWRAAKQTSTGNIVYSIRLTEITALRLLQAFDSRRSGLHLLCRCSLPSRHVFERRHTTSCTIFSVLSSARFSALVT